MENPIPILGHNKIISFLQRLIKLNKQGQTLTGSYIFAGPSNLGKKTALFWFIQSLLCERLNNEGQPCKKCQTCQQVKLKIWPDIHIINREQGKKNISIEQIREMIKKLSMSSFLDNYKIGIIHEAETLSISAANSLLKLLEEPNQKVLIFLLANNPEDLPLTVVSRSQVLQFRPIQAGLIYDYLVHTHKVKRSIAKNLSQFVAGRPGLALDFLKDQDKLDMHLRTARLLLESMGQDINYRLQGLYELVGNAKGQKAVDNASAVLDSWQNITRDLLMLKYDQADLVQHQALIKELEEKKDKQSLNKLLYLQKQLIQAKQYLAANVNPKLTLEHIIINI
ncbi:MAG: hypothetical protein ABIG10_03400 [bacterium]